ncbi:Dut dUTPase [uncultured Caudovirales phage]|uniref:dUTP diphosphatase n=1 Tax=uncultured Caudovirales phage TaxID=2100421 RepID=A0A6J5L4N8_9CAUD|nr:Dut dUTPase [uncultured Caudovirales phage]CAB5216945.1 Dut dUTPase [uncultured Caudovirales phage]
MKIKIVKLDEEVITPFYGSKGAAGFDIAANEEVMLYPGKTLVIKTGLQFEIPAGYELQIRPRSGLSLKSKLRVLLGTVDSDYRGEVGVITENIGDDVKRISKGDRIAQGIIAPIIKTEFEIVDSLSNTDRGSGGFGSTGLNVKRKELEELHELVKQVIK